MTIEPLTWGFDCRLASGFTFDSLEDPLATTRSSGQSSRDIDQSRYGSPAAKGEDEKRFFVGKDIFNESTL